MNSAKFHLKSTGFHERPLVRNGSPCVLCFEGSVQLGRSLRIRPAAVSSETMEEILREYLLHFPRFIPHQRV